MRRAHRSLHVLIWIALVPVIAVFAWMALGHLPTEPVNDDLPYNIGEES